MTAYVWAISPYAQDYENRLLNSLWGSFVTEATVPIKMHVLEDNATPWANLTHVGFGLLGEQGAESIHAKFT